MSSTREIRLRCDWCGRETDFELPQPTSVGALRTASRGCGWTVLSGKTDLCKGCSELRPAATAPVSDAEPAP